MANASGSSLMIGSMSSAVSRCPSADQAQLNAGPHAVAACAQQLRGCRTATGAPSAWARQLCTPPAQSGDVSASAHNRRVGSGCSSLTRLRFRRVKPSHGDSAPQPASINWRVKWPVEHRLWPVSARQWRNGEFLVHLQAIPHRPSAPECGIELRLLTVHQPSSNRAV